MSCSVVFSYPIKYVGEQITITFDFAGELTDTESLSSSAFTATVHSGIDDTPQAIVSGGSQIFGTEVRQLIVGGKPDTVYNLLCTVTTSNGQTFTPFVRLPVKTAPF